MEKDKNSGIVPNIIDIQLGDINGKKMKKLIKGDGLLGNFQGEIQILGRYDVKKFVENVLKNEDKPLVLCLQFENSQSTIPKTRYITLQTTYKMCRPLDLHKSDATPIDITIVDNKIVRKDQERIVNEKETKHYSKATKSICGQIQSILPPCCTVLSKGKDKVDVAKGGKTLRQEINADDTEIDLFGTRFGIKFHDPDFKAMVHKNEDNINKRNVSNLQKHGQSSKSGATGSNLKVQEVSDQVPQHLVGRDDMDVDLLGKRFGIKFNDTDIANGVKAGNEVDLKTDPPSLRDARKNKNRRWLLEEGAEDIDWKKWGIPDGVPKDTICRCSYYFEDGQCKCHELLRKMNFTSSGPVYIFHDDATSAINMDAAGGRSVYQGKAPEKNVELNNYLKDRESESGNFADKNGKHNISITSESPSNIKIKSDERNLFLERTSGEKDGGFSSTKDVADFLTLPQKSTETMRSSKCGDCGLGKSCCKCCKCKKTGKESPRRNLLCDLCSSVKSRSQHRALKLDDRRMDTCIQKCNRSVCDCKSLSKNKEKPFLTSVKTHKDDCVSSCKRSICNCKTRSKMKGQLYPLEGERDKLSIPPTAVRGIPFDSRLGKDQLPLSEIGGPGEIMIIPSTKPIKKLPLDGKSGDLSDHFYCGCTGFWIEYYSKKSEEPLAEEEEPPEQRDVIPGFSFMLESCTLELDKNNIPIDKDCLVRQQEIDRFHQSGYKHQPKTLIMNDPYSTPLRIYEVSPGEGKRFLSGHIEGKSQSK